MSQKARVVPQKGHGYPVSQRNVHAFSGMYVLGIHRATASVLAVATKIGVKISQTRARVAGGYHVSKQPMCFALLFNFCNDIDFDGVGFFAKDIEVGDGYHANLNGQGYDHANPAGHETQ